MSKIRLIYFDLKHGFLENFSFLKRLYFISFNWFFISVLFIVSLATIDSLARYLLSIIESNNHLVFNREFSFLIHKINDKVGVEFLEYFKDIIVIVAGILGVILGLFFTTFLSIVSSKYSNINSQILTQLLEQKVIKKYFKLLTILVSSSIIFQFFLGLGFQPTIISCSIYTFIILFAIVSFTFFGRDLLVYFNAGTLCFDLINSSKILLNKVFENKVYFDNYDKEPKILHLLERNINKIALIVDESLKLNWTNTSLDSISKELLGFAIYFNSLKHILPTNKEWHQQIYKYKKWSEATGIELQLSGQVGASIMTKRVDDYIFLEKILIKTQFKIFNLTDSTQDKINLIYKQINYLPSLSGQCEFELYTLFFNLLDEIVYKELKLESNSKKEKLSLIYLYINLLTNYLVFLNNNIKEYLNTSYLKEIAKEIHEFKNVNSSFKLPYQIKVWSDKYHERLINEKYIEGTIYTQEFFAEHELVNNIQLICKTHIEEVFNDVLKRVSNFSNKLKDKDLFLENLELLIGSLEIHERAFQILNNLKENIYGLNSLVPLRTSEFIFEKYQFLIDSNKEFQKRTMEQIWQLGYSGYSIEIKDVPDVYGNFYRLILKDILEKGFQDQSTFSKYLPKFLFYNKLYIDSLKTSINFVESFHSDTKKLYPLVRDLFEISAIAIILFKVTDNDELEDSFFSFWNKVFDEDDEQEKLFWMLLLEVYNDNSTGFSGLRTSSYINEHGRKDRLEYFIKNEINLVRLEEVNRGHISFIQTYVTDIEDVYFKLIVNRLSVDGISSFNSEYIAELFIEFFLRTRIVLKDYEIKETNFGEALRRYVEAD